MQNSPNRSDKTASADAVDAAARSIRAGGVVAYPNEGVFGFGCRVTDEAALERILALKRRPEAKGFIVIGANAAQLAPFVDLDASQLTAAISQPTERPTTWIVPSVATVPGLIRGGGMTIAVRVSGHPVARALCDVLGHAIVSTSANRTGEPPMRTLAEVAAEFTDEVDVVVPGECPDDRPTRIVDWASGRILRD